MAHLSDIVSRTLKEAIKCVFWEKKDLKRLLQDCNVPNYIIQKQDWEDYKIKIIDPLIDELNKDDYGLGPLNAILKNTLDYKDCSHLLRYKDGQVLKNKAEHYVQELQNLIDEHNDAISKKIKEKEIRQLEYQKQIEKSQFQSKLDTLKDEFETLWTSNEFQKRGYSLENLLYDLFQLFDLNPKGPFTRKGEQIDGAFVKDSQQFLLEAKWKKEKIQLYELRDLDGAVSTSLDNTLGLFVAINGYTSDALAGYLISNRPKIVCMDGDDLMLVLSGQIDLRLALSRKIDIAVEQRNIFTPIRDILQGLS